MLTIDNGVLLTVDADVVREQIEKLVVEVTADKIALGRKMVRLGLALNKVKVLKLWEGWGFDSFNEYLGTLKDKVEKGRTQLYGYQSAVENLLPYTTEQTLESIGITKATEITSAMRITGRVPSEELLLKAADPKCTTDQLRAKLAEEWRIFRPEEKEKWFDLGGFFATKDEIKEIEEALDVASRTDPQVPAEWTREQQRKECLLRMAREYVATWKPQVDRGEL